MPKWATHGQRGRQSSADGVFHVERKLVELLVCEGLDNAGLARRFTKSERTIAEQLTRIYRKLDRWRGFPADAVSHHAVLIAELAPYLMRDE